MLQVITPNGIVFKDPIYSISFKDINGDMVILKDYCPTIGKIEKGLIKIKKNNSDKEIIYFINGGLYTVSNNILKIMTAFCVENTDEERKRIDLIQKSAFQLLTKNNHELEFSLEVSLLKNLTQIKKNKG